MCRIFWLGQEIIQLSEMMEMKLTGKLQRDLNTARTLRVTEVFNSVGHVHLILIN